MQIKDVAFVAYPSDDVAGTRTWYENMLGLAFAGPYIEDGVEKYNEAHLATTCFSLMASEWVGRPPGAGAGAVFEVDDIDAAIRELGQKGVAIDDVFDGPVCKSASFVDPEENKITLHEAKRTAHRSVSPQAHEPRCDESMGSHSEKTVAISFSFAVSDGR